MKILCLSHIYAIMEVHEKQIKSGINLALVGGHMYKFERYRQLGLADFNQPAGLKMNPDNRWIRKAAIIPWDAIEEKYAELFPSETGMPAKPLRMALGSLMIQKQYGYSDRELVEQITENPYYQYFVGLPGFTNKAPFVPSLLVEFRKRLDEDTLNEINEMIIAYNIPDDPGPGDGDKESEETVQESENRGTVILDATCAPQNITYPQDVNLLNEARENLEVLVDRICYAHNYHKPRMYRKNARRDYLSLAKCKKRTAKRIRKAIKQQLQYIRRDLGYIEAFLADGVELTKKQAYRLCVVRQVYAQQLYMNENKVHAVADRIVSISQPYIRPIVRGKAAAPVEFGAKLDLSIDENGMARLEKLSFDAYNESDVLIGTIDRYRERTGHYPERVLVDKIYRNRTNLAFCKQHGIRISGPSLGRPKKDAVIDKKTEYVDNADRVEVERSFSLAKRCYGLGRIMTKLDTTTRSSIVLSILTMNVARIVALSLRQFLCALFSNRNQRNYLRFTIQKPRLELSVT